MGSSKWLRLNVKGCITVSRLITGGEAHAAETLPHGSGGRRYAIEALAALVSPEASLLAGQAADFSLCPLCLSCLCVQASSHKVTSWIRVYPYDLILS